MLITQFIRSSVKQSIRQDSRQSCSRVRVSQLSILLFSVIKVASIQAFPFPMQDARTAALGGASVAIDVRNAPFANPALMATGDENYDWIVMLPSRGEIQTESDDFDVSLNAFQQSSPVVDSTATNNALAALDQKILNNFKFNIISVVIPNELISAVAFSKKTEYHTVKIKIDKNKVGPGANDFNTYVEHRAITVQEQGISLAKLIHDPYLLPFEDVMFGMNVKLSLIKAYGYDEGIIEGSSGLDQRKVVDQTGSVNFDFGFAKEFGVWKIGLVIKDVFKFEREYGNSGDFYKVKPLIRTGFAYRSRKTLWELDVDVTSNESVGHQSDTKYIALGFEHELISGWQIRLGIRKNTTGDGLTTQTGGMGINVLGVEINIAVLSNSIETGAFSQLIVEF